MAVDVETVYYSQTVAPLVGRIKRLDPRHGLLNSRGGYLAGTFPDGITRIDGVPAPATIRVLLRSNNPWIDGMVVAVTQSGEDGTWHVGGLDTSQRYDVVCRHDGFNDLILSDVTPMT